MGEPLRVQSISAAAKECLANYYPDSLQRLEQGLGDMADAQVLLDCWNALEAGEKTPKGLSFFSPGHSLYCGELPCVIETDLNTNGIPDQITIDFVDTEEKEDCYYSFTTRLDGGHPVRVKYSGSIARSEDPKYPGAPSCRNRFIQAEIDLSERPSLDLQFYEDEFFGTTMEAKTLRHGLDQFHTVNGVDIREVSWRTYTAGGSETMKSLADQLGFCVLDFYFLLFAGNPGIELPVFSTGSCFGADHFDEKKWKAGTKFWAPVQRPDYSGKKCTNNPGMIYWQRHIC